MDLQSGTTIENLHCMIFCCSHALLSCHVEAKRRVGFPFLDVRLVHFGWFVVGLDMIECIVSCLSLVGQSCYIAVMFAHLNRGHAFVKRFQETLRTIIVGVSKTPFELPEELATGFDRLAVDMLVDDPAWALGVAVDGCTAAAITVAAQNEHDRMLHEQNYIQHGQVGRSLTYIRFRNSQVAFASIDAALKL